MPESRLSLRRGDQAFVACLLAAILAWILFDAWRISQGGREPLEIVRHAARKYDYQIDVNEAPWVEWVQLDGIGEDLAKRIVADREAHGPFSSLDDLKRVPGVGDATLARIRPWLRPLPTEKAH
jgi:competence protein ComEA